MTQITTRCDAAHEGESPDPDKIEASNYEPGTPVSVLHYRAWIP
jgi:hypothetical protein